MSTTQSIGLSGLIASQRLLDLAGQNIANAGAAGYHRQVASPVARVAGQGLTLGVDLNEVRRVLDFGLEQALTRNIYGVQDLATQLESLRQIEGTLQPGEGSLSDLFEQVRNQAVLLTSHPDDATSQRVLLNRVEALADKINNVHTELRRIQADLDTRLRDNISAINDLAKRIADMNETVARATLGQGDVNAASDQRDQMINDLAKRIDVRTTEQDNGVVNVFVAGIPLVAGNQSLELKQTIDADNQARIMPVEGSTPLDVSGGEVHGLLEVRNRIVADVIGKIESWSKGLVAALDHHQATGLGVSGPFQTMFGTRPVSSINAPLESAALAFPPQAGSLFISVTNQATGQRTLHEIAVDPSTQDIQDIAAAISTIPNLQGVVNPQSRTLTIVAQTGYGFDFAGRLPTAPETVAFTGTSQAQISGSYSGPANDVFTFRVVGTGTIGVTPNLTLEARDGAGALLMSWNIGQGYEPGTALAPVRGVSVRLGPGTANTNDSFSTRVVAESDSAGLLLALGLGTFFAADAAGVLRVRDDLSAHPEQLAGSRSGLPADGGNWQRLVKALDANTLGNGSKTFGSFLSDLISDVGSQTQDVDLRHIALESLGAGLEAQRQSVSGVDPNEELLRMLQYQRSFQTSAKFLSVVHETMQDLLTLV